MSMMHRVLACLSLLIWMGLARSAGPPVGDFGNYFTAAWRLDVGADPMDIFDIRRFTAHAIAAGVDDRLVGWAVNNPACSMVMWPLVSLGFDAASVVWWWTEGALVITLAVLIGRSVAVPMWVGFLPIFALWPAFQSHLHQGQVHLIAAVALTLGWIGWRHQRPLMAGGGWGLAVGLKVHAWPLLLLMCIVRQWRMATAMGAVLIGGLCLSVAVLGLETIQHYLMVVAPAGGGGWFLDPWHAGFQSLGGALRRGMIFHPGLNPSVWIDAPEWAVGLTQFVYLGTVGWTVTRAFAWRTMGPLDRERLVAASACVALCFGPLLSRYHLVLLAPVLAWGVHALARDARFVRAGLFTLTLVFAAWCDPPKALAPTDFLCSVPRFWALALGWAILLPSGARSTMARWTGLGAVGFAAMLGVAAEADSAPENWERIDGPGFPLMAADLVKTEDGSLWFSGLTADRQGHAGFGWVGYRLGRGESRPRIVAADPTHHIWSPVPVGLDAVRWQRSGSTLPLAGRLEGEMWIQTASAAGPDPGEVFLADLGAGARTMRLWKVLSASKSNGDVPKPSATIEPPTDSGR